MKTLIFFILISIWAAITFTACSQVKECYHAGWEMPNGVVCTRKVTVEINQQIYLECSDSWEYVNPPKVKHVEKCG